MAKAAKKARKKALKESRKQKGARTWKLYERGATVLGGVIATQASTTVWRLATGKTPPRYPNSPELRVAEAVVWAALAGASIEMGKILLSRRAASYWYRSTGNLPPGMTRSDLVDGPDTRLVEKVARKRS